MWLFRQECSDEWIYISHQDEPWPCDDVWKCATRHNDDHFRDIVNGYQLKWWQSTTIVSMIGSRRCCMTCTGCAFLNASSSVWPFLCSAAPEYLARNLQWADDDISRRRLAQAVSTQPYSLPDESRLVHQKKDLPVLSQQLLKFSCLLLT